MSQHLLFEVGQTVEVYWPSDDEFYPGRVTKSRQIRNYGNSKYFVKYDDGDEGWVDPTKTEMRILHESDFKQQQHQRDLRRKIVEKLTEQTRVRVSTH